jgi:hypothetical protein
MEGSRLLLIEFDFHCHKKDLFYNLWRQMTGILPGVARHEECFSHSVPPLHHSKANPELPSTVKSELLGHLTALRRWKISTGVFCLHMFCCSNGHPGGYRILGYTVMKLSAYTVLEPVLHTSIHLAMYANPSGVTTRTHFHNRSRELYK